SSDTAASIRVPAALTGVVGLKPTLGRVSTRGVFPLSWSLDTVGPHAKTVDDAMLLLEAIVGDGPSTGGGPWITPDGATGDALRGMRLGVPRPYFFDRLQPDVAAAVEAALALLADLGARVMETPWPDALAASAAGAIVIWSEGAA